MSYMIGVDVGGTFTDFSVFNRETGELFNYKDSSTPADPSRIGYQLACNCDWEEEHGMEIDVLDGKLVYLCEYGGESPWDNHTDEEWNYALRVQ